MPGEQRACAETLGGVQPGRRTAVEQPCPGAPVLPAHSGTKEPTPGGWMSAIIYFQDTGLGP